MTLVRDLLQIRKFNDGKMLGNSHLLMLRY